jgi:hypothetical protein
MMIVYREALSNNAEASVYTFVNAVQDNDTFSPINRDRDRSRSRTVLDLEREILQAVEEEPNVSCRRLAQGMGVSSFTIWRTQNERRLHPHIFKVSNTRSSNCILSMASSENMRKTQSFTHRLNHR